MIESEDAQVVELGHVYLLSNPAMAGLVKIGHTKKAAVELRVAELSASTSVPLPFVLERAWLVERPQQIEAQVNALLASVRISKQREFFRSSVCDAAVTIDKLLYGTNDANDVLFLEVDMLISMVRKYPERFNVSASMLDRLVGNLETWRAERRRTTARSPLGDYA